MKKVLIVILCFLSPILLFGQYEVSKASKDSLVFEYEDNTFCIAMGKKGEVDIKQYPDSNKSFIIWLEENRIDLNNIPESVNDNDLRNSVNNFISNIKSPTPWLYNLDVSPIMEYPSESNSAGETGSTSPEEDDNTSLMTKILIALAGLVLLVSIVMLITRYMKPNKKEQPQSGYSKSDESKEKLKSKKGKTASQDSALIKKITKERVQLESQIKEQSDKEKVLIQKLKDKSVEVTQLQNDKSQMDKIYTEKFLILAKLMNEFISRNEELQKDYGVLRDINNFKDVSNFKDFIEVSFYFNAFNKDFIKTFSEKIEELELFKVKSSAKTLPLNNWEAVNAGRTQKLDDMIKVNAEVLKINDRIPLGIRNLVKELNKLEIKNLKVLVEKYKLES